MTARDSANHESDVSVKAGEIGEINDDVLVDRPEDEDHDLLTFGEAGARLEEELIKQRRVLDRLREGGADADTLERAGRRLEALERARSRNQPPSLRDLKSSGFFGTPT